MALFGKYLLERGALTHPQLVEATQSQVIFGGRLGTNLVELGYLRVDELERHLSEHLGVPVVPGERLAHPEPGALKKVPADLAASRGIFPLAIDRQTLHLAMSDPRNPDQIDDSAFATGLRIQPYVVSELRLTGLLESYYGIRRETRYIDVGPEFKLGRNAPRASGQATGQAPSPARIGLATAERDCVVAPLADGQDLIDEESFSALQAAWQGARIGVPGDGGATALPDRAAAAAAAASVDDVARRLQAEPDPRGAALAAVALESGLAKADDRDRVGRLAVRLARLHARAAALFVVRGGMIAGFQGDGETIGAEIDRVLVSLDAETLFAAVATSGRPWRGQPPVTETDGRVLSALGRPTVREALVLPIAVRGHVINLLYADNDADRLAETAVAALGELCGCVSRAYERLILERKNRFT